MLPLSTKWTWLRNLAVFFLWKDSKAWAHGNHSFDVHLSYLWPESRCFSPWALQGAPSGTVAVVADWLTKTSFICWIGRWGCLSTEACQVVLKPVDKGGSCLCFRQKIKSPLYNYKLCRTPASDTVVSRYSSFQEYENYLEKKWLTKCHFLWV